MHFQIHKITPTSENAKKKKKKEEGRRRRRRRKNKTKQKLTTVGLYLNVATSLSLSLSLHWAFQVFLHHPPLWRWLWFVTYQTQTKSSPPQPPKPNFWKYPFIIIHSFYSSPCLRSPEITAPKSKNHHQRKKFKVKRDISYGWQHCNGLWWGDFFLVEILLCWI